ncbi:response regulator [Bradyrhizobium sp. LHD-71]|uniref:response regulator transcription factor n=1 Tax=Bradyrhizobium sp. LHD-71 TaxID=3072141 RepID=UPI00280D45A7|nr:response regulator [Bradyrhizobium sp. LHD-71]MDQ8726291.1 response regulator [Bradyrhizobium sp. LHD-71]
MPTQAVISIVDDDQSVREATVDLMNSLGFGVEAFPDGETFLKSDALRSTRCLIADVQMPGIGGLELYARLIASGHAIPMILITAYPDEGVKAQALKSGLIAYLTKPFSEEDLISRIDAALEVAL